MKDEKEIRKLMLERAARMGCKEDLQQTFDKWDRAILLAPESEKVEMSRAAILEVQALLDIHPETGDGLTINGEVITEAAKEGERWKSWGSK